MDPGTRLPAGADLHRVAAADPIGHAVHVGAGAFFAFSFPFSTPTGNIAFGVLGVVAIVRLWRTWGTYATFARSPLMWLLLAWPAWLALSLLWSEDQTQGLVNLRATRTILTPWLLWPVIGHLPLLLAAFLGGVLLQNGVQLLQALGVEIGEEGSEYRLPGMIHAIHTAAFCLAAACWAFAGAVCSRGRSGSGWHSASSR